jgi:hypothetical protein
MKKMIFFTITIFLCSSIINCFVKETLLIKSKKANLYEFTPTLQKDDFEEVDQEDVDYWDIVKRKFNFFKMPFETRNLYKDYNYEVKGIKYKRIYACLRREYWDEKRKYLWSIFREYEEEINSLKNITIIRRTVVWLSKFGAESSDCFILTGIIADVNENEIKDSEPNKVDAFNSDKANGK